MLGELFRATEHRIRRLCTSRSREAALILLGLKAFFSRVSRACSNVAPSLPQWDLLALLVITPVSNPLLSSMWAPGKYRYWFFRMSSSTGTFSCTDFFYIIRVCTVHGYSFSFDFYILEYTYYRMQE